MTTPDHRPLDPGGAHEVSARRTWAELIKLARAVPTRSIVYAVIWIPLGAVALLAVAVGDAHAAERWWSRSSRWLGIRDQGVSRAGPGSVARFGIASLPIAAVGLMAANFFVTTLVRQLTYPLSHPHRADYLHAWGGPSLAGAWAVHAAIGLALIPVYLIIARALVTLQSRLSDRIFDRRPAPWLASVIAALLLIDAVLIVASVHRS